MNKIEERIFKLYERYKPYYEKVHIITRNKNTQKELKEIFKNNGISPVNRVYISNSLSLLDSMRGQFIQMVIFEDGFQIKEIEQLLIISYIENKEEVNAIIVKEDIDLYWTVDKRGNIMTVEKNISVDVDIK